MSLGLAPEIARKNMTGNGTTSAFFYEPQREKTNILHMRKQRCRSLFFLSPKFQAFSRLLCLQAGLCQSWSETPKTGFHASRHLYDVGHGRLMNWLVVRALHPTQQLGKVLVIWRQNLLGPKTGEARNSNQRPQVYTIVSR